ncbi:MAG: hypothetical protein HY329_21955, partial [Chloroflexi bacterium]|nr:hypothetical protein [Chloroflexota bacterium]
MDGDAELTMKMLSRDAERRARAEWYGRPAGADGARSDPAGACRSPRGGRAQPATRRRPSRLWALLLPITLLVLTSAYEAMDTRAVYVTAVETDLTFAPGTVDVAVGPTSAFISAGGMLPGDATTAPLEVRNTGTLEFAYTLLSSATNPDGRSLASQLGVTIKTG